MSGRAWSEEELLDQHLRGVGVQVLARVSPHLGPSEWLPAGADPHHPVPPSPVRRLGRVLGLSALFAVLTGLWVLDPDLPERRDDGPTGGGSGARAVRVTGGRGSHGAQLARAVHRRQRVRQWLVLTDTVLSLVVQQRPRWVHRSRPDALVTRWSCPRTLVTTTSGVGLVLALADGSSVKIPTADAAALRSALGTC